MTDFERDPRLKKAVEGLQTLLDLTVRDIMNTDFVTLNADDLLATAARTFIENRVNETVVMDESRVFHVLTSWELLHQSYLETFSDKMDYLKTPLRALIEEPGFAALAPDATLARAISVMAQSGHQMVVVLDGAELLGVITLKDVIAVYDRLILSR